MWRLIYIEPDDVAFPLRLRRTVTTRSPVRHHNAEQAPDGYEGWEEIGREEDLFCVPQCAFVSTA